jgi:hypothetical protein
MRRTVAQLQLSLKPVVGNDYPAVLRQMKANGSEVLLLRRLCRHQRHARAVHQDVRNRG